MSFFKGVKTIFNIYIKYIQNKSQNQSPINQCFQLNNERYNMILRIQNYGHKYIG